MGKEQIRLDKLNKAIDVAGRYRKAVALHFPLCRVPVSEKLPWSKHFILFEEWRTKYIEWNKETKPLRKEFIKIYNALEPETGLSYSEDELIVWGDLTDTEHLNVLVGRITLFIGKIKKLRDRLEWEQETPGARDEVKSAYRFEVKEQDVWCNGGEPFKAEPRLASILNEFISNPGVEVKTKRLQTVSRLDSRMKVREAVRDLVCWLKDTFKIDIKILDKMFEPTRDKNRKYVAYTYHSNIL